MEILGLDPRIMTCKVIVLPVKLYPLYTKTFRLELKKWSLKLHILPLNYVFLSEKRLERSRFSSTKLKLVLSTIPALGFKAKMTRTPNWAIMSSLLYQLSYNLFICGQRNCTSNYWSWANYVTFTPIHVFSPRGSRILASTVKKSRLNHLTIRPI